MVLFMTFELHAAKIGFHFINILQLVGLSFQTDSPDNNLSKW